ncbi:hypothetical protein ACVILK_005369 [Bradyrhizobium embrapense]
MSGRSGQMVHSPFARMFGFKAAVSAVPVIFKSNYIIQFRSGDLYKSDVSLGFNAMDHAGHDVDNIDNPKIDCPQTSSASLATIKKSKRL